MRMPRTAGTPGRGIVAIVLGALATAVAAVPLAPEEIAKVCAQAEGQAHCGRLVEEVQLKRLPSLAVRNGVTLEVSLYPTGSQSFIDTDALNGGRTFNLWDFISEINTVVLYATDGDDASFTLLQRVNGRRVEVPSDPRLSPDRARLVTADFCATRCGNELALWRVARDGIRKELTWTPNEAWQDATAAWADADTLVIEYTVAGAPAPAKIRRKLADPGWMRAAGP